MFDGIERAQDLDEFCKDFFSDKTDPPLPTLRQTLKLEGVQVHSNRTQR